MKIKIGRRASRQAERASDWWHENRSAAELFDREFGEALRVLAARATAGVSYPTERRPALRRLLLPKTEYHVYFALEREDKETLIVIHSVWGARRERGPKL